jgi:hypothetical protein
MSRRYQWKPAFGWAGFSRRTLAQPELVVPLVRIGRAFKSAAAANGICFVCRPELTPSGTTSELWLV